MHILNNAAERRAKLYLVKTELNALTPQSDITGQVRCNRPDKATQNSALCGTILLNKWDSHQQFTYRKNLKVTRTYFDGKPRFKISSCKPRRLSKQQIAGIVVGHNTLKENNSSQNLKALQVLSTILSLPRGKRISFPG